MDHNVFLSNSEFNCNVWLDMNNNIITNLPAPVNLSDGVNKQYVDSSIASLLNARFIKVSPITRLSATNVQEALSEINQDMDNYLPLSGGIMTGVINMNNHSITNLPTASEYDQLNAANVQYVNTYVDNHLTSIVNPAITKIQQDLSKANKAISSLESSLKEYLPLAGGTMTGDLQMNNHTVTGLTTPNNSETTNAANVQYVNTYIDTYLTNIVQSDLTKIQQDITKATKAISSLENSLKKYLPLAGGSMTGDLQMNNHTVTGLTTPNDLEGKNAANVQYVNTYINNHLTGVLQPITQKMQQDIEKKTSAIDSLENSLKEYLPLAGGSMTGDLQMNNHTVTGVTTPNNNETTHAANVQYVNNYLTTTTGALTSQIHTNTKNIVASNQRMSKLENSLKEYLPLSGGSMTGNLQMNNNTVTGLVTPNASETTNAANVQYVNNVLSAINYSPFYSAIQFNPPYINSSDSGWIVPGGMSNTFLNSANYSLFFAFDYSYSNLYLLQKGLYLFNFNITQPYSSASAQINIYLNNSFSGARRNIASFVYNLNYGGYTSAIIPIEQVPQENEYYLTLNATQQVQTGTCLNIIWLPIG